MRLFLLFIGVLVSFTSTAQDFTSNRITPILKAHREYFKFQDHSKDMASWDCPPKLKNNTHLHFSFLDSLPLNLSFEEELLTKFISNQCTDYYSLLWQYQKSKPIYDSILSEKNINPQYAILPLIVSGCNPSLKYQSDKSGEWQLSYINARKYGLHVDHWVDERNSTTLATIAASNYIQFLNTYYLNNEFLVITAYLTSVPYVNQKINKLDTVNTITFFNSLAPELQGYFSYLRSWSNWLIHFKQGKLNKSKNAYGKESVSVTDTLDFTTISKFMQISEKELETLNPVLIGKTAFPESNTDFYLPPQKATQFNEKHDEFIAFQKEETIRKQKELEKLRKQMESGIPDLNTHKAVTYMVKSGDVLGKIAARNKVKVSQIKQWNNLKSDRINIGQRLVLYVPKNSALSLPEEKAENKIEVKPTVAKPGKGQPTIYTVKNGESLWLISKKFPGVSAQNIMEWNGCTDKISPGMKLKIYAPE